MLRKVVPSTTSFQRSKVVSIDLLTLPFLKGKVGVEGRRSSFCPTLEERGRRREEMEHRHRYIEEAERCKRREEERRHRYIEDEEGRRRREEKECRHRYKEELFVEKTSG
jgi:hypothetical protein